MHRSKRQLQVARNFIIGIAVVVVVVLGFSFYRARQQKVANYTQEVTAALKKMQSLTVKIADAYVSNQHNYIKSDLDADDLLTLAKKLDNAQVTEKKTLLKADNRAIFKELETSYQAGKKMTDDLQAKQKIEEKVNDLFEKEVVTDSDIYGGIGITLDLKERTLTKATALVDAQKKVNDDAWAETMVALCLEAKDQLAVADATVTLLDNYRQSGTQTDYLLCQASIDQLVSGQWKRNLVRELAMLKAQIALIAKSKPADGTPAAADGEPADETTSSGESSDDSASDGTDSSATSTTPQTGTATTSTNENATSGDKQTPSTDADKEEPTTTPTTPDVTPTDPDEGKTPTTPDKGDGEGTGTGETGDGSDDKTPTDPEEPTEPTDRPLNKYDGSGQEFATNAEAEAAGEAVVMKGTASSYTVVEEHYASGKIKYYLELVPAL